MQSVLDDDAAEGYSYEAQDAELEGSAGPSACQSAAGTQQRHAGASSAHEDRMLQFEKRMRQHNAEQLQWGMLSAPLRAASLRQDLEQHVGTVQQRVHAATEELVRAPVHVGCTASVGSACCLAVHSWRQVLLLTIIGTGSISIPTLK